MDLFPDFGKYSFFVWTCYGISVATLLCLTILTFVQNNKYRK